MKRLDIWLEEVSGKLGIEPPTCPCIGGSVCQSCCLHDAGFEHRTLPSRTVCVRCGWVDE